jgi:hypothetical protein
VVDGEARVSHRTDLRVAEQRVGALSGGRIPGYHRAMLPARFAVWIHAASLVVCSLGVAHFPSSAAGQDAETSDAGPAETDVDAEVGEENERELDPSEEQARLHFRLAESHYAERSYETALREFGEAYALSPRPRLLYNISLCHERLGHFDAAAEHLERYLASGEDIPDRTLLERRLANLRERARPARVDVRTAPESAVVTVDGEEIGRGEVSHELVPGRHHLEVSAEGYDPLAEHFVVEAGETHSVVADLEEAGGSIWTNPIFWTIVGVIVIGAAVGIGVGIATRPEEYGGTADRIFVVGQ